MRLSFSLTVLRCWPLLAIVLASVGCDGERESPLALDASRPTGGGPTGTPEASDASSEVGDASSPMSPTSQRDAGLGEPWPPLPEGSVWAVPGVTSVSFELGVTKGIGRRMPTDEIVDYALIDIHFVAHTPQRVTKTIECTSSSPYVTRVVAATNAEANGVHVAIHNIYDLYCDGEEVITEGRATWEQGCEDDCAGVGVISFDATGGLIATAVFADGGYRGIKRLNPDGTVEFWEE